LLLNFQKEKQIKKEEKGGRKDAFEAKGGN
jgi:hypothetical protein